MNLEILSFIIGGLLLLIGIVGGGIEIKELKIPKVKLFPRFSAFVIGLLFIIIGLVGTNNLVELIRQKKVMPPSYQTDQELMSKAYPTTDELMSKVWQFSHGDGSVIADRIRLLDGGKIDMREYYHPNESRWDIEDNHLVFYHENGEPTCRFASFEIEEGKIVLRGPLLFNPDVIHVLREVE